jgi:glycosyltransferase involved in cell wall biosynthesis
MVKKIKKLKKFSIIDVGIPLFNESKNIQKTLRSLKNQTFKNIRFIILDNISNDQTTYMCKKITKNDKRFYLFKNEKKISSFNNFNNVFKISNAKYFFWNSGHDLRSKNFIKDSVEYMERNKDVGLCYSNFLVNSKKNLKIININNEIKKRNFFSIFKYFLNIKFNYQIYGVFRTSILNKTGLLRNVVGGDEILVKEVAFLSNIKRITGNSYTNLFIKNYGSWNEYLKKHLLDNKSSFLKNIFLLPFLQTCKLFFRYEKNNFKIFLYIINELYKTFQKSFFYYKELLIKNLNVR